MVNHVYRNMDTYQAGGTGALRGENAPAPGELRGGKFMCVLVHKGWLERGEELERIRGTQCLHTEALC